MSAITSGRVLPDGGIELHHNILPKVLVPENPVRQTASKTCAFWYTFPPFAPNPAAPFQEEFNHLANQEGWSKKEKRMYLVEALNAEINFHSDDKRGLVRYQRLWQELGLSGEPQSNTQCKKVSPHAM